MMTRLFQQPENLHWLWLVAIVAAGCVWGEMRLREYLCAYRGEQSVNRTAPWTRSCVARSLMDLMLLALLVGALADPRWGYSSQHVPKLRTQIVFLVDVSRSMLAEDIVPSRWEQAKSLIEDQLMSLSGEPAALVTFSGSAATAVPLTRDYTRIRQALEELKPGADVVGGTQLASALEAAAESFVPRLAGEKVLVMITDGEDHGAGAAKVAARLWRDQQIRCIVLGVGDPHVGGRIPLSSTSSEQEDNEYLTHDGKVVWSKLNVELLKEIAESGGGRLVTVTPAADDEGIAAEPLATDVLAADWGTEFERLPIARFPWLLAAATGLLLCDIFLARCFSQMSSARSASLRHDTESRHAHWEVLLLGAITIGGTSAETFAAEPRGLFEAAATAFREARYDDALEAYQHAAEKLPDRPEPIFNRGVVLFLRGDWAAARNDFTRVIQSEDSHLQAMAHYNLGNCLVAEVREGRWTRTEAVEKLWEAIGHFRAALSERPDWTDPRVNIELTYRLLRRIEQMDDAGDDSPHGGRQADHSAERGRRDAHKAGEDDSHQNRGDSKGQPSDGETPPTGAGDSGPDADVGGGAAASGNGNSRTPSGSRQASSGRAESAREGSPSRTQAERLLAEIRARDRQRQREKSKTDSAGRLQVDKDW